MTVRSKCLFLIFLTLINLMFFNMLGLATEKSILEVHFIDVDQGDSILLHSPNGVDILIDAGYPANGQKVLDYLHSLGVNELDMVIATHPHADHIGGFPIILQRIKVRQVIDPGVPYASSVYEGYLTTIRDKKIPFKTVLAGDEFSTDDPLLKLHILSPYQELLSLSDDINDVSIVIRASYGEISFLFTGDAGFTTEDLFFVKGVQLKSTILKVGHHGSKYSTGDIFLMTVEPEVGVIQVGVNTYGHPTEDVLQRLKNQNISIYRNDLHGTIIISTNGKEYQIKVEKADETQIDHRLNLNTAPLGDILDLPGMTIQIAQDIVKYRERYGMYLSEMELLRVKSLTPELLEQILPYIKFAE